ncbi:MAG: LysM peptidoglycan-binding domain-containing protein, partial [Dehalococcoidia bacterium]
MAGRTAIDSSLTSFQSQVPAFTAGEASAPAAVAWTGVEPTGIAPGLPAAQSAAPADVLIPAQGEPTARESAASFQMEVGAEPLSGPLPSPELVRPLLDVAGALTQLALDVPLPPPAIIDHLAQALREQRLYSVYEIQQGDTLTAIAQRFGLSIDSLLWNNNELRDHPDYLKPGEELLVPATDGIVYNVKLGDTLLDIAATYNVDVEEIVGFRANNLSGPEDLKDGAVLLLPGARPPALGLGQLA